ncbi:MAG: DegT/DnrJ/EryC1/StrS family aminotransferase [Terriglobales bacterium]
MANNSIPFLDLITPHKQLEDELVSVCQTVFRTSGFIGGPMVEQFELEFAQFCGAKHAIGVSNGTDALMLALTAAGIKPGEAVITVPNTFIATVEAISHAGAAAKFVDVDPRTYNMDPEKLREFLETKCVSDGTGRLVTRDDHRQVTAVIPVHLYGQMADMDPICALAAKYGLIVIEDACQAHGAEYYSNKQGKWLKAGSVGTAAAFSFYPGKNLGACGEGGAVTTNDPNVAATVKMLRDHGQAKKYYHDIEGYNGRLDALQAGLLAVKLKHLERWNEQRRTHAKTYNQSFVSAGSSIVPPYEPTWSKAVYHLYVVEVDDREAVQRFLGERNVGTGIHYPIPLHLQKAYAALPYKKGDFPVAEVAAAKILSLPMFPQLMPEQLDRVVEALTECLQSGAYAAASTRG